MVCRAYADKSGGSISPPHVNGKIVFGAGAQGFFFIHIGWGDRRAFQGQIVIPLRGQD